MEATCQEEVSNHPPLQGLKTCGDKCGCKDNCECNYGDQYMGLECTCSSNCTVEITQGGTLANAGTYARVERADLLTFYDER